MPSSTFSALSIGAVVLDEAGTPVSGLDIPAAFAGTVTPDDDTDLAVASRALYVGTAGDLAITTVGGSTVTLKQVSGWVPVRVARVLATGTTATNIVALW
ncbi:conserved hypothetical protein [uncultured Pleomorphomonas sp.]|uniref:Uncharacterized protein n=1 Tax=uncultured Pleomorphomonas sp. TaxID=442121 RepID=A0A212LQY5_9HYPH|nr:hypothetical protein [uncultured Pleomorphomonas sp.]SCM80005.1 conserved hypothetical protein [uncultured Pleomorphomonas sp.]